MKNTSNRLDLFVEPLEHRELLAGNVVASINPRGDLIITGDAESNQIEVSLDSEAQSILLTPMDGATSINDANAGDALTMFHDVDLRDLKINMKSGNDEVVVLGNFATLRNARAQMGSGNDSFSSIQTNFTRNVSVILGTGVASEGTFSGGIDQRGAVFFAEIGGNLSIRGSKTIDFVQVARVQTEGRTSVQLSGNDDRLSTGFSTFGGSYRANLGGGNDEMKIQANVTFSKWAANGGQGDDTFEYLIQPNDFFSPPSFTGFESIISRE